MFHASSVWRTDRSRSTCKNYLTTFSPTYSASLIGYFEDTWVLNSKTFSRQVSERTTLQNLWLHRVTVHCYPWMLTACWDLLNYTVRAGQANPQDCTNEFITRRLNPLVVVAGADPGSFLGGGALVSCSTSIPINHIVFFFFFFWQNTNCIRKPQVMSGGGGGGCAPPAPSL